jgi:hypothetical protein
MAAPPSGLDVRVATTGARRKGGTLIRLMVGEVNER